MSRILEQINILDQPIKLTPEEREDPLSVLIDFFSEYRLGFIREMFSEIGEVCLTSEEYPFDVAEGRGRLIVFHRKAELFMEAVYILIRKEQDKQALKQVKGFGVRTERSQK